MREFIVDNLSNDILLMFTVTIVSIITTIGGVGGGGLLIPLYMLIGDFQLEESVPLTIFTILGDTVIRIYFLYNKKHPLDSSRYLIYFPPLLIITLFDANSSFIGVILSKISPNMITIICLLSILGITFYKSLEKAIHTYTKEHEYLNNPNSGLQLIVIDGIGQYFKQEKLNPSITIGEEITSYRYQNDNTNDMEMLIIDGIPCNVIDTSEETTNIEITGDTLQQKYFDTALMFANIGIVSIFSFTRTFFSICNYYYWIHVSGQLIVVGGMGYYTISYIIKDYNDKRTNNYSFIKGDIVWNYNVATRFIFIGSITGFVSTYIGIGGGMLTTPIMIYSGMIPEVVVATSSVSTLSSCIISCLNYLAYGKLPLIYGSVFAICSGVGSIFGIYISNYILEKYKRQSPIIFFVGLIVFLSIILITINSIDSNLITDINSKDVCHN